MRKIRAFIKGVLEFRSSVTTHYDDLSLMDWYDRGRELAHVLTLRRFEGN